MASLPFFSLSKPSSSIIKACTGTPTAPGIADILDQKFGRKGIKFSESNNGVPLVELTVRNGSSLRLQIPDGHLTSYKPKVFWTDDGFEEVLYTLPNTATDTDFKSPKGVGGIGLVIHDASSQTPISTSEWVVKDVDSDSIDALQVELSCASASLEITYIVSLSQVSMATAVIVKNNGREAAKLTSAILSHFKFKRRSGAAIQGLKGCSYCSFPPPSFPFEILSPFEATKSDTPTWFSSNDQDDKPGSWTVQDVPFTILKNKFSRLYATPPSERTKPFFRTPPSKYETLDQGRELFFRVIRMGYEDIYLSSPGSFSKKYGNDYFICTGPATMLVPIVINPGENWRGAQVIEHDNL